jgi:hypothetical protein
MDHGFETSRDIIEGSSATYENLDNCQTGIHDYFKFLKYGFGRATDLMSSRLRRGQISRKDAIEIAAERDAMFPATYLGVPLRDILKPIGMSVEEFLEVCDTFTNHDLFAGSHVNGDIRPLFRIDDEVQ